MLAFFWCGFELVIALHLPASNHSYSPAFLPWLFFFYTYCIKMKTVLFHPSIHPSTHFLPLIRGRVGSGRVGLGRVGSRRQQAKQSIYRWCQWEVPPFTNLFEFLYDIISRTPNWKPLFPWVLAYKCNQWRWLQFSHWKRSKSVCIC